MKTISAFKKFRKTTQANVSSNYELSTFQAKTLLKKWLALTKAKSFMLKPK